MTLSQFTLFPQLPAEIRIKVWGFALYEPRTVNIDCKKGFSDISRRVTEYFICHDPPHPILHVNRESRDEGIMTYAYRPMFQIMGSDRYIYINCENDVIHCSASVLEYLGELEIKGLQKMVLEVGDGAYFGHFHMDTVRRMENLEEVKLMTQQRQVYSWDRGGDIVLERLRADFETAQFEDPGWRCPKVRIVDKATGEESNVVKGGPLVEGWTIGDEYPEHLL